MPSLFVVRGRIRAAIFGSPRMFCVEEKLAVTSSCLIPSSRTHRSSLTSGRQLGIAGFEQCNCRSTESWLQNELRVESRRNWQTLMIFTAGQPREMDAAHGVDIVLKSQRRCSCFPLSRSVQMQSRSGGEGDSESDFSGGHGLMPLPLDALMI